MTSLENKKVAELKEIAKGLGLTVSKLKKAELIEAIIVAEKAIISDEINAVWFDGQGGGIRDCVERVAKHFEAKGVHVEYSISSYNVRITLGGVSINLSYAMAQNTLTGEYVDYCGDGFGTAKVVAWFLQQFGVNTDHIVTEPVR